MLNTCARDAVRAHFAYNQLIFTILHYIINHMPVKKLIFLMLATLTALSLPAKTLDKTDECNRLRKELANKNNPVDSLSIFYDIFDLSAENVQSSMCESMYFLAERAHDDGARLDLMRNYARINDGNDSIQAVAERLASRVPRSPEQLETMSYIRLKRTLTAINDPNVERKRVQVKRINELILRYSKINNDSYDILQRVETLFSICLYLNSAAPGGMLSIYLARLQELIKKLPHTEGGVGNMYYNFAMSANMNLGDAQGSLEACRNYIKLIDDMEKEYHKDGREFRDLDIFRYRGYLRMLSQYEHLEPQQIEEYYGKLKNLSSKDAIQAEENHKMHLPEIFYAMAKKNYTHALELLSPIIDKPELEQQLPHILPMFIRAAHETGDSDAELHGLELYNENLKNQMAGRIALSANELQILYDSNNLHVENNALALRNQQLAEESSGRWILLLLGLISFLFVALVIIFIAYRRARLNAGKLRRMNDSIKNERDSMHIAHQNLIDAQVRINIVDRKKNDFIQNISSDIAEPTNVIVSYSQLVVDSIDEQSRSYLERYIQVVKENSQLLQSLVNDMIDSANAEHARINVVINNFSLSTVVNIAAEIMRKKIHNGVSLNVRYTTPEVSPMVDSDSKRVEQVLVNLLANAAKFTSVGHIDVDYGIDRLSNPAIATITVSDTGIGIPAGKEEVIFTRFEKLNPTTQGIGLGLYVCRKMAVLIGGQVYVDNSYRQGARFVFSFPVGSDSPQQHPVFYSDYQPSHDNE